MPLIWDRRSHLRRESDQWEVTCKGLSKKRTLETMASYDKKDEGEFSAGHKPRGVLLDNGDGKCSRACNEFGLPSGVPHAHHDIATDPSPQPGSQATSSKCHSQSSRHAGGTQPYEKFASSLDNSGHEGQNTVRVSPSSRVLQLRNIYMHDTTNPMSLCHCTNREDARGPLSSDATRSAEDNRGAVGQATKVQ
jgi:hypothetical protein